MQRLTGKTIALLQRLAHFYAPAEAGELLLLFAEMFGRRLERAELDLYHVLRSHHVETATNQGSQGYIAPIEQRGDLDKIFALYLEALGGTSQLIKMNPRFTQRSFDAYRLSQIILTEQSPLQAYLDQLIDPGTWKLLRRYTVDYANVLGSEVQAGLVLELLVQRTPISAIIAQQLAERCPQQHQQIQRYNGGSSISRGLALAVAQALNQAILADTQFFTRHYAVLSNLSLPSHAWSLIYSLYREFLRPIYAQEPNPDRRSQLLNVLDQSESSPNPLSDDVARLNRMIVDAALGYDSRLRPWGLSVRRISSLQEVRQALMTLLNQLLDDPQLVKAERFPDLAEDLPILQTTYADDLIRLNRYALETTWDYALEPSHAPYRERLQGLIAVLKRGASTRQGILDIVAANLGIVGNDPAVAAAKALIDIEEFLPKRALFFADNLKFYQEFAVDNINRSPETPHIWITMLNGPFRELTNIELIDIKSGQRVRFPGRLQIGDRLTLEGTQVLRNGIVPPEGLIGTIPQLKPGVARWRLNADIIGADGKVYPAGAFDKQAFDQTLFVPDEPIVRVEVSSYALTYGVFTVTIPWHIAGFTDKFDEGGDHPRQQILNLVNRVKAAGVQALVAYKQVFQEDHDQLDRLDLRMQGRLLNQQHDVSDSFDLESQQRSNEQHDVNDSLVLAGQFDYTRFDSLNTFA